MENERAIVDLFDRYEERFFIPLESTRKFLQGINRLLKVKKFSENECVETVYFNNLYHEMPWGTSIKARRYKRTLSSEERIQLNLKERYLLEIKKESSRGSFSREKKRYEFSLDDAIAFVNRNESIPSTSIFKPYVVTEYRRTHFIFSSNFPLRVTVDNETSYWYIPPDSFFGEFLGTESYLRVEVKTDYSILDSEEYKKVKKLLKDCNARLVISKKYMAYNLLCRYRTRLGQKFPKELKDCEIEAKLLINLNDASQVFRTLQQIYNQGKGDFRTEKIFPYTFESASINEYFYMGTGKQKKEALKFLFKGGWVKSLYKDELLIVENFLGLDCITKRQEIKLAPYFLYTPSRHREICCLRRDQLKEKIYPDGSLMRLRKAFWVESLKSGRLYHLSVDQCTCGNNRFCQLEIEYSASPRLSREENPEYSIVEDIARIVNQIVSKVEQPLRPTPLTKFQWLERLTEEKTP